MLPVFALPLAAGGAEALLQGRSRARATALAAAGVAGAAVIAYAGLVAADPSAPKRYFVRAFAFAVVPLAAVSAAAYVSDRRRRLALGLIVGAVVFESLVHTIPWYPSVRKSEAYPPVSLASAVHARGGRMIRVGSEYTQLGPFPPDLPMQYGVADAQGLSVLFPAAYDRYLRLIEDYGNYGLSYNVAPPLKDAAALASPLVEVLDVRTAVVDPSVEMSSRYPLVADGGIRAYAVRSLGPAVLVEHARPATTQEMWRSVQRSGWNPTRTAAVVGLEKPVDGTGGKVELVSRGTDDELWHVTSRAGGLLRISGNYDDGWKAHIDGRSARVLRSDGIFRSVVVPPGSQDVALRYRNSAEGLGRWLCAAALVLVALMLVPLRRRSA
jgi:hypothetical protein